MMQRVSSNHALERTATRFAFILYLPKTFLLRATLASGGRRSASSRSTEK